MNGKLGKIASIANTLHEIYKVPVTVEFTTLNINIVNKSTSVAKIRIATSVLSSPADDDYVEYDFELQPKGVLERTSWVLSTGEKLTLYSDTSGVIARAYGFEEVLSAVNAPTGIPVDGSGATGTWNISVTGTAANITGNLPVSHLNGGLNASSNTYWRGDGTWASIGAGSVLGVTGTGAITSSGGSNPVIAISPASQAAAGSMSAADKAKLDGIAAGAQVNVPTNLAEGTRTATTVPIVSTTGTNAVLNVATNVLAGVMSGADKAFLNGLTTSLAAGGALEAGRYIDMHGGTGAIVDYDVRLDAGPGTGVAGGGTLTITAAGGITCTGDIGAYSDERLKSDWKDLEPDFLSKLANVKKGTFSKDGNESRLVGVSAQSLKEVLPEAVIDGEYLSVLYGNAALVAAIQLAKQNQELIEVIKALSERVRLLENKEQ